VAVDPHSPSIKPTPPSTAAPCDRCGAASRYLLVRLPPPPPSYWARFRSPINPCRTPAPEKSAPNPNHNPRPSSPATRTSMATAVSTPADLSPAPVPRRRGRPPKNPTPAPAPAVAEVIGDYERERAARIRENMERMQKLGILDLAQTLSYSAAGSARGTGSGRRRRKPVDPGPAGGARVKPASPAPSRRSLRYGPRHSRLLVVVYHPCADYFLGMPASS
jgi:hypothetical protein